MYGTQTCPRCLLQITNDRLRATPVVCNSCGHVLSPVQKATEDKLEKYFLYSIVGFSVFMLASFMHVASWGGASLEVIGLKTGELLGSQSPASQERMAEICLELKKYQCTEKMYAQRAANDFNQLARLGKFQLSQRKFREASHTFKRFFAAGGSNLEVTYMQAKALAETGAIDEAAKHFEEVLAAKPDVLQITVVQNYVKYLVDANRLDEAKSVIQRVRSRGETVSSFMDYELKDIMQRMGSNS